MKIIVTGAGGQLGSDLAKRLSAAGLESVNLDSSALDITDREAARRVFRREKPAIVINCAAYVKVDQAESEAEAAFKINAEGPAILAEEASRAGAALAHVSTDFVFDGAKSSPYTEEDETNPLNVYGRSKLEGERRVMEKQPRSVIVRTSWLYGSRGSNFVKTMIRLAEDRETLRVVCDQVGRPTWTGDLADALVSIAKRIQGGDSPYGIYHYSNEGFASWFDFAKAIVDEAGSGACLKCKEVIPVSTAEYPTPATRPRYSVLDSAKIKATFGLDIPHWRDSLRAMLKELYREEYA